MKKYWIVFLVFTMTFIPNLLLAQQKQMPFFDKKGNIRIQTTEMNALADTIAVVNHRADDVVWSRIVYKIIDMREKQNFQLYFPMRANDEYKSLFRIMLDAICKGVPVYRRNPRDIVPSFSDSVRLQGEELSKVFAFDSNTDNNLIQINLVTKEPKIGNDQYFNYIKNQFKFLIQEIVFFDKHTSRMYSKIMAIAPLYTLHPDNTQSKNPVKFFQESVLCWFAFDELRPYLARQYVIPNGNETQRLTYDEFFAQKLFSTYLLGDSNMFNRMLLESEVSRSKIKKEQNRIETEILNFEEDLWEY
jgi:gliding motility associated protien GldN